MRVFAWLLVLIAVVAGVAYADPVRVFPSGTLTIPAGSTSGTISVPIQGDTLVEPDEQYTVTIAPSAVPVTAATATGTIINDDGIVAPVVSIVQSATVRPGSPAIATVTRAGDTSSPDRVRWVAVPYGQTGASEADFPAVLVDEFSSSSLGSEWCASDGSAGSPAGAADCPAVPESPLLGLWDSSLVSVSAGSLHLGLDLTGSDWTAGQVVSKRAFHGGLLEYAVTFPAGKGGAHSIYRVPDDHYYGPGPRSGQIDDVVYIGKTSAERDKTWLSQLQYSGPDDVSFPAIAGQLNNGTVWSGSSRAAKTRWWVDSSGAERFSFQVGNTVYWQPRQGDWPPTRPWTLTGVDEDGNPVSVDYPGGGANSPFDRPFHLVLQSGVGGATSVACSGETSCPDVTLSGAEMLVDYVRYYQYPTGEMVFQPGQSTYSLAIPTRDPGTVGTRDFAIVLVDADNAQISALNGQAIVRIDPNAGAGIDHGSETYALDFGLDAGGFVDDHGVTWTNGNQYVTGGTSVSDIGTGGIGGWTPDIEDPPDMTGAVTFTDVCPGEAGWPTRSEMAGKNVKVVFPTDRDCYPPLASNGQLNTGAYVLGGTNASPAINVWVVGPTIRMLGPGTNPNMTGNGAGLRFENVSGVAFVEGADIDLNCNCTDVINTGLMGAAGLPQGIPPVGQTPRLVIENSRLAGSMQCSGPGATHGDIVHAQGAGGGVGVEHELKMQNVWAEAGFQGLFVPPRSSYGHGVTKLELDHVHIIQNPRCNRIPTPGWGYKMTWNEGQQPRDGVFMNETYMTLPQWTYTTTPSPSGFDSNGCAKYSTSQVNSGTWCKGNPPKGDPAPADLVGRNYDRATFTGGTPPSIEGASVPRLDHTRLTGSTMNIAIPVDTTGGNQRILTLGFSARDEAAVGERSFDISGAVVRPGFDIYAFAGARDTEARLVVPVTVDADGYLRFTLTGVTGDAQINWLTITRPTVSVTLDKAVYAEGDTGVATFTREGPTSTAVSMGYVRRGIGDDPADGADFGSTEASGTAPFPSGVTTYTVPFAVTLDGISEPAEGFEFALTGGVGADINPSAARAAATISASGGGTGGGGDECNPVGAGHKTIRMSSGSAIDIRKTGLVVGSASGSAFRGLNTKCTTANVCVGRGQCILGSDPKGLQADTTETKRSAYLHIDPVGKFNLSRGQQARDAFVYEVCTAASCSPMIADIIVTGE